MSKKTKLGKIRVAAGLGKPAAGDADMGDVASRLTNQPFNLIEDFVDGQNTNIFVCKYIQISLGIDMADNEKR